MTGNGARFHVRCAIYNKVYSLSPPDIPQKPYYRRDNAHNEGRRMNTWNIPLLELPQGKISEGNDQGNGRRSSYFFLFQIAKTPFTACQRLITET